MEYIKTFEQLTDFHQMKETTRMLVTKDGKYVMRNVLKYYESDGDFYFILLSDTTDDIFNRIEQFSFYEDSLNEFNDNGYFDIGRFQLTDDKFIGYFKEEPLKQLALSLESDNKLPYTKDDFEVVEYTHGFMKKTSLNLS
jgi:hypothetical protein